MEETISLQEVFEIIKKRFALILSFMIGAALIAAVISFFVLTPIYQSGTQFIVNQSMQDAGEYMQIDTGTIRTNVELINTYNVIITSKAILKDVIKELNLTYSPESLANNIHVSSEQNSQVVTVTALDPDPILAAKIANTTVAVFQEKIPELMHVDNVKILSEAETEESPKPVEPKPSLNIAIALVLGVMTGVGLAFLLEYLDTSVKTMQDVEGKLGVTLLGVISTMDQADIRKGLASNPHVQRGGSGLVQTQK